MLAARSNAKVHLLAILAVIITIAMPTTATGTENTGSGIWWYGSYNIYSVTLINLTKYPLITTYSSGNSNDLCYPYPFEHFTVNVAAYGSAVWRSAETGVFEMNYQGKLTFLPNGLDPKWAFNLNMIHQDGTGAGDIKGTWLYLTANDTTNTGWVPSWDLIRLPEDLYRGMLGYATHLDDKKPHNLMNLEATGLPMAVSMFSPNNSDVILVVQELDDYYLYRAWMLNWADNDQDSMPH